MRVFGLTVGRNEAPRYLIPMLRHSLDIFDDLYFYDDQSSDETPDIVHDFNCSGEVRPDGVPSFLESEGAFRAAAWEGFQYTLRPNPGDWVMVIDCDEALVSWHGSDPYTVRSSMEKVITAAHSHVGVNLTIPEVFGYDGEGYPLIRTDRLWGTIHAPRLFPYRPGADYYRGGLGVPAVPSYVMAGPWFGTDLISLMHYGYAEVMDQQSKYQRYVGTTGHSSPHVESIVAEDKVLVRWDAPFVHDMKAATWKQSMS